MATLSELRGHVYAYLGETPTNKAFPPARLTRWLNDALNQLRSDVPLSVFTTRGTWTPDGGSGRVYSLATQSVPVTTLRKLVEVRLDSTTGQKLRELPWEQLEAWAGGAYAITGPDESAVLTTSTSVDESATLYVVYETWPSELSADGDTPSWLPTRFHDVPALMAAKTAFASGDEGTFPGTYDELLMDRLAQLTAHWRRRSGDVALTRASENPVF